MVDYKELYFYVFNGISDIIEIMEKEPDAKLKALQNLKLLQVCAEEKYLRMGDSEDDE